ncbi:diacylglycerol/lipid kinase family protein [Streptosporangium lutulentum]
MSVVAVPGGRDRGDDHAKERHGRVTGDLQRGAGSADDDVRTAVIETLRGGADVVEAPVGEKDLEEMLDACPGRDVVVLGGDGSLHVVVSTLYRRGELDTRTVGLVPLGTGNDFARGLGIPLDPQVAARVVLAGRPHPSTSSLTTRAGSSSTRCISASARRRPSRPSRSSPGSGGSPTRWAGCSRACAAPAGGCA